MPEETMNKRAEGLARISRKPLILAVNKADLITMRTVKKHRRILERIAPCVFVSCKNRRGITFLKKKMFEVVKKRSHPGLISIGVIGYPNTGKSSLINALAGRKKAIVGSKPGLTRGVQWISGGPGIRLIDTPGIVPLIEGDETKKALIGIIDSSKLHDPEDVAMEIVKILLKGDKKILERVYGIEIRIRRFNDIINKIGKSRGMLRKGGVVDERRVHLTIIDDWQKGKLLLKNV
jgi:ribosome biogenesis GTPase A